MAEAGTGSPSGSTIKHDGANACSTWNDVTIEYQRGDQEGSDAAGTVIEPVLPYDGEFFVLTVFLVGTTMMVVNTVIEECSWIQ